MNKNIKIPFVSIQITNKCNLDCPFCFRRNVSEEPFSNIKKIIDNLKNYDTDTIVISGGEPLLRKDLKDILVLCKKHGFKTALQSNGLLLNNNLDYIAPYVDWISLSLDGESKEKNTSMRNDKQFDAIIEVLPEIKKRNISVKLGTVVNKKNYKDIENIGFLIKGYVDVWKLYQFYPRGGTTAEKNKSELEISDDLFNKISNKIKNKFPDINISTHTVEEFNKSPCLMIDPDGKVFISKENKDFFIGDIINDKDGFAQNYLKMDILGEIEKNFEKTYKA